MFKGSELPDITQPDWLTLQELSGMWVLLVTSSYMLYHFLPQTLQGGFVSFPATNTTRGLTVYKEYYQEYYKVEGVSNHTQQLYF